MDKKHKIKIYTLGCKVNQYDSGWLGAQLHDCGFEIAKSNADLAIINTCAVTKAAIRKDRQMISKAKKENPEAKIVVIGCWPKTYVVDKNDLSVDQVLNSRNPSNVIKEIKKMLGVGDFKKSCSQNVLVANDRARYFIKIQDGCEQFCSYCIIPFARGPIKSRDAQEIIEEIKLAIKKGYQEFVLTGIHLGLYGKDLGSTNLVKLLQKIVQIEGLGRVRLSSVEITEVSDDLIKLIAHNKKICKHLHVPLQSGCDKILKLMNRPYDTKFFRERVKKIRKTMPEIALTTDVIVGFPGEDEKDFNTTFEFIKKINFSRLHIFPFSAHEKTKAYSLPDKVDEQLKKSGVEKLRELSSKLEIKYRCSFKGKIVDVLIEKKIGDKYRGKTEHYLDIEFSKDQVLSKKQAKLKIGEIVQVKL
ncbi:MAG: Threonylcarbamoyladenosine tRNA methylthiotransferase MtaB [Parcubacteria group bacterium ADurb.Bin316]|nr:MAG: Threonylcarbamoyladenosine tRNA methylthiotransferase MtaB [Parcubacteria group bacterium ADurb.Bin316]HOZ56328.1 tRNA (N(6)-L-threonylcarbamoyladenosine(37)-C(2))-methylthiotransferase MtaB [bacterium]